MEELLSKTKYICKPNSGLKMICNLIAGSQLCPKTSKMKELYQTLLKI
jgi:hypothetical protein